MKINNTITKDKKEEVVKEEVVKEEVVKEEVVKEEVVKEEVVKEEVVKEEVVKEEVVKEEVVKEEKQQDKKCRLTFFFPHQFSKYNLNELVNLLKKNGYLINIITHINNINKKIIDNTDCFVINSEGITLIPYIFNNYPYFLKNKKIIIIRTILSYDCFHIRMEPNITNSLLIKNVYTTINPLLLENEKIYSYGNKNNLDFHSKLLQYNNVQLMPIWFADLQPTIDKITFYKKYNLDPSKKIFTIYLTWPKYYRNISSDLEKYFLENNDLIIKIKEILNKLNYNVVFKPHPFYRMKFKPNFVAGPKWKHILEKKSKIPMEKMKTIIPNHTFIEMVDTRNIDIFTDMGLLLSCSTFALHNYIFNIPLLYVTDNEKIFASSWYKPLKEKYTSELFYGTIVDYDNFNTNTDKILDTFVKEYENKPDFKYGNNNNPLYGNTQLNNDVALFSDYIQKIISKK